MYSLIDSSNPHRSNMHSLIKAVIRPVVLKLQKDFKLYPQRICLISGAPRSGTTALFEWLSNQQGVSAFPESRILVSIHRFMEEVHRFKNLESESEKITNLARHLIFDYYSSSRILIGKRLLVDKEPLEPIAFPSKEYKKFIFNLKKLLPDSKLLFVIRDPIATIWSMSRRPWGESLTNMEIQRFTIEEHTENWCSCADLILQYQSDPNTYIVQFGCLVNDSENETRRIFDFLNIPKGIPFQAHQTKKIGFSNNEREKILQKVQPRLELLKARGISNLS